MIRRSSGGIWRSSLLDREAWLGHGFGTAAQGPGDGLTTLRQIHSSAVLDASEWNCDLEGDALLANAAGVRIAVKTADCLPILLADPVTRSVAAVHAGWRGTLADVAGAAVRRMTERHGAKPAGILAAFGPSIGPCCFEVGPEVAPLFRDLFPERTDLNRRSNVDLREANVRLLIAAGVLSRDIDRQGAPCTFCGGAEFHSWRRDRATGARMFSAIWLV